MSRDDEDELEREKLDREWVLSENVNQLQQDLKRLRETVHQLQQENEELGKAPVLTSPLPVKVRSKEPKQIIKFL